MARPFVIPNGCQAVLVAWFFVQDIFFIVRESSEEAFFVRFL